MSKHSKSYTHEQRAAYDSSSKTEPAPDSAVRTLIICAEVSYVRTDRISLKVTQDGPTIGQMIDELIAERHDTGSKPTAITLTELDQLFSNS